MAQAVSCKSKHLSALLEKASLNFCLNIPKRLEELRGRRGSHSGPGKVSVRYYGVEEV